MRRRRSQSSSALLWQPDKGPKGYRQIAEELRSMILAGVLPEGRSLPPVRHLSQQLGVSLVTVQRAYAELRRQQLVSARSGSGTFVAAQSNRMVGTSILSTLSEVGALPTYETLSDRIGLRSLATAGPDPKLFLADELMAELQTLAIGHPWAWHFGDSGGAPELRWEIARAPRAQGIAAQEQEIVVTNGSTQALSLLLNSHAVDSPKVIVEDPTYLLLLDQIDASGRCPLPVLLEEGRLNPASFHQAAMRAPGSLAILSGSGHPATGRVIPQSERLSILEIASKHNIKLIEVNRYGRIAFEPLPPPFAALDPDVIHVDSFSYSLAPGLRIGFLKAPRTLIPKLCNAMKLNGISGPTFLQTAFASYLSRGFFDAHLSRVLPEYRSRRQSLLHALDLYMPHGTKWTVPQAGYSSWVTLPPANDYSDLYSRSLQLGCAFAPSELMSLSPSSNQVRLSFGCLGPGAIKEAVKAFAKAVAQS